MSITTLQKKDPAKVRQSCHCELCNKDTEYTVYTDPGAPQLHNIHNHNFCLHIL